MKLSRAWTAFLALSLLAGLLLRVLYVNDMEWKEDEQINFNASQAIGFQGQLPWLGMPSGVYLANPGMSVWVFGLLAKILGAHDPTSLAHGVQLVSLLGISLILPFALKFLKTEEERKPWLWAMALALVNPILILYQRKLWPEGFLPIIAMALWMGWWKRENWKGASAWGFFGACLGQVHMSGFFLALAAVLWTLAFAKGTNWKAWFAGSCLGAAPLIPWAIAIIKNPVQERMTSGIGSALELKFWVFWISDPLGLHLGNALGLLRGNSHLAQLEDFFRYPLIGGSPTYLVGIAHALILGLAVAGGVVALQRGLNLLKARNFAKLPQALIGRASDTAFAQNAAGLGFGVLLTATCVNIRRYYLCASFPFEFIFIARAALARRRGSQILATLWLAQLLVSAAFVGYIHVNQGAVRGDYGPAYRLSTQTKTNTK